MESRKKITGERSTFFKEMYAESGDDWADKDLTLVVCIHEDDPNLSAYWNQVELDRYFCRKFVVDTKRNVGTQLRRLPFIPLNPERVAGLVRPLSAQTLLRRKHGLEAWLADALAIPGGRSPESIVKKALTPKVIDPPIFQTSEVESFVSSPNCPTTWRPHQEHSNRELPGLPSTRV